MRVLGVIPARGGSKGVKEKNIKPLGGKPLIAWTIEAANRSSLMRTIVSTDSLVIAEQSRYYGGDVPFIRPDELATDEAKSIPVILHALNFLESEGENYEAVMMLQPTTPFRTAEDIDQAIQLLAGSKADSVISVIDVEGHHPARMKYLDDNGFLLDPPFCEAYENQPRQELKPMYLRNGAIYLTRRDILLQGSFKGNICKALIMPYERSVNIDTSLDFVYADWIYEQFYK